MHTAGMVVGEERGMMLAGKSPVTRLSMGSTIGRGRNDKWRDVAAVTHARSGRRTQSAGYQSGKHDAEGKRNEGKREHEMRELELSEEEWVLVEELRDVLKVRRVSLSRSRASDLIARSHLDLYFIHVHPPLTPL